MKIVIVGLGVIGGGYAMALKDAGYTDVYGVDKDVETLKKAKALGIIKEGYKNENEIIKSADLIVLAIYPNLVKNFIINNKEKYNIEVIDKNIDFRRVRNLDVYLKNNSISLTKDLSQIEEWQGGDIIVFKDHIGIISDKRNKKGIPFLIHHANPIQVNYEEDVLELYGQDYIIGHYRIS